MSGLFAYLTQVAEDYGPVIWAMVAFAIALQAAWSFVRKTVEARREQARQEEEIRVNAANRMRHQREMEEIERAIRQGPSVVFTGLSPPLNPPPGTSWVDPRTGYLFVFIPPARWRSVSGQTSDFIERRAPEGFPQVYAVPERAHITVTKKPVQPSASKDEEPFSLKRRVRIKAPTTLKRNAIPLRKLRMPD